MTGDSAQRGLRQGIEASADEFGEEIVDDLPTTAAEARSQLPEDLDEAAERTGGRVAVSVRRVLAEARIVDDETRGNY